MADITLITQQGVIDLSRPCNTDLSAKQYFFVKHDTSEEVVICGANDPVLGILQNAPDGSSAEAVAVVRIQGTSKIKLNETVAFGDRLTATSTGNAEVVDAADEEMGARTLSSGESGDLIASQLMFGKSHSSDA